MMRGMIEVKAHMIEREAGARGILDRLLDPLIQSIDWLVAAVRKHPLAAVLVLLVLLFLAWKVNK